VTTPAELLRLAGRERRIRDASTSLVSWMEVAGPTELGDFILADWQRDAASRLEQVSRELLEAERAFAERRSAVQIRAALEVMTQAGKTELIARWLAWHMATTGQSVALGSYAGTLSAEISNRVRALLRSGVGRRVWPHLQREADPTLDDRDEESGEVIRDSAWDWSIPNVHPGRMNTRFVARGRKGGLNGRSVWLVVADDLLKDEMEYNSAAMREEAWTFLRSSAETRLATRGGAIVLVGSRWGSDDPIGRYRKQADKGGHPLRLWSYPLRARAGDIMGRALGAYLMPGWSPEREAIQRATYGERLSRAILDCDPMDDGGGLWTAQHFSGTYSAAAGPAVVARSCAWTVLALDGAETAGGGDWSVLTWVGFRDGRYVKLWQWRQQVEFPELLALVRRVRSEVNPNGVLIEVKSSGKQVYQTINRDVPGVVPVQKSRSKRDCYLAASPVFEGRSFLVPDPPPPWLSGYVERMTVVTGLKQGEVDDEADADTMVILWHQAHEAAPQGADPSAMLRQFR
jgi:phage terminase large subunit-like protein